MSKKAIIWLDILTMGAMQQLQVRLLCLGIKIVSQLAAFSLIPILKSLEKLQQALSWHVGSFCWIQGLLKEEKRSDGPLCSLSFSGKGSNNEMILSLVLFATLTQYFQTVSLKIMLFFQTFLDHKTQPDFRVGKIQYKIMYWILATAYNLSLSTVWYPSTVCVCVCLCGIWGCFNR